jgi:hypothetical protein
MAQIDLIWSYSPFKYFSHSPVQFTSKRQKVFLHFFNSVKTDEPQAVPFAHFPGLAGSPPEIGKISHSSEDRSQSQEIPRFPARREKEHL